MDLFLVIKIDGAGITDLLAESTGTRFFQTDTGIGVDLVFERYCLGIFNKDRFAFAGAGVVFAIDLFRTFLGAGATGDTLVHVHIAGCFFYGNGKIAGTAGDTGYFTESHQLDV